MRQWIPLDVRNVDKPIALRNQLRRLNEYMSDLAAALAPTSITPQQPDSLTIFNDILQKITVTGSDAKNLIFFDDFMYDPQPDPAPGASGVWRTGSQGAGGTWATEANDPDPTAFGVHQFASKVTVNDAVSIHMWDRSAPTLPILLVTGLEIGFRVRRDAIDFTQGQFTVSIGNGFSADSLVTNAIRFVIANDSFNSDDFYYFDAVDTAQSPTRIKVIAGATAEIANFRNVKLIVTGEQAVDCYIDGVLLGSLTGVQVPSSSTRLALQIYQATIGGANPIVTQKSYIDRLYIDVSRIDRGKN